MMKYKFKISIIIIVIALMLPTVVNAEVLTFGNVLDDLSKAQKDLEKHNQSLGNTQGQIQKDNATIRNLKEEIQKMQEENTKLQQEIAESALKIEEKKEQTKNLIVYLQMSQGENVYLEYVFGSESITDMVYRLSVVEQITEYNEKTIKELEALIKANEARKVELAANEEKAENKIAELNKEISRLNKTVADLNSLSPSLKDEVEAKQTLVDYYKKEGCKNRSDVIGRDCAVTTSNATFSRPIKSGYVTSFIGYRWGSLHRGIDIGSSTGRNTALYSIGNGVITKKWKDSNGALCVNIQYKTINGEYYTALYAHLSRYGNIYEGMKVDTNTIIGYMGDTGYAFGVHLHLEVWPCRLYGDSNCSTWNRYVNFVSKKYNEGFRGAESVINFPSRTYQTWYTK